MVLSHADSGSCTATIAGDHRGFVDVGHRQNNLSRSRPVACSVASLNIQVEVVAAGFVIVGRSTCCGTRSRQGNDTRVADREEAITRDLRAIVKTPLGNTHCVIGSRCAHLCADCLVLGIAVALTTGNHRRRRICTGANRNTTVGAQGTIADRHLHVRQSTTAVHEGRTCCGQGHHTAGRVDRVVVAWVRGQTVGQRRTSIRIGAIGIGHCHARRCGANLNARHSAAEGQRRGFVDIGHGDRDVLHIRQRTIADSDLYIIDVVSTGIGR